MKDEKVLILLNKSDEITLLRYKNNKKVIVLEIYEYNNGQIDCYSTPFSYGDIEINLLKDDESNNYKIKFNSDCTSYHTYMELKDATDIRTLLQVAKYDEDFNDYKFLFNVPDELSNDEFIATMKEKKWSITL